MKTNNLNPNEYSVALGSINAALSIKVRTKSNKLKILLLSLFFISFFVSTSTIAFADGTRDIIKPNTIINSSGTRTTNPIGISLFDATNGDGRIATPEASDSKRKWYIRIEDPNTEVIYLGFNISKNGNGSDKYYRVIAPDGVTIVKSWALIPTSSGEGYIESFYETFNGPQPTVDNNPTYPGTGYDPITVDVSNYTAGDYIIEFNDNPSNNVNYLDFTNWRSITIFKYFDISVGRKNNNISGNFYDLIEGRFYAYIYSLYNDFTNLNYYERDLEYYAYQETDMVMSKLTWDNVVGGGWNILFNSNGAGSSGDLSLDRMSNPPNATSATDAIPQYKVFFAPPDTSVFPVLDVAPQFNFIEFRKDCLTGENAFYYEINRSGTIEVILEFDNQYTNGLYDPGTTDRLLVFDNVTINTNKAVWDGKDGQGNYRLSNDPNNVNTYNITFRFSIGVINNPIFDVERINGGLSVELYAPILTGWSSTRSVFWDDRNVNSTYYYSGSYNYSGCNTGCHTYPDAPYVNYTNSRYHPGNQIWMNSWWSSFDLVTSAQFSGIENIDTIPIVVNAIPASDCDTSNGALQIEGLVGGDSYSVSYSFNGQNFGPSTYIADGLGIINITNLETGLYYDVIVDQNNYCNESKIAEILIPCFKNIYGSVFEDNDGVMNVPPGYGSSLGFNIIDGIGINEINNTPLYVVLQEIDSLTNTLSFIEYIPVNSDGTYRFANVQTGKDYQVLLTNIDFTSFPLGAEPIPSETEPWYKIGEIHNNETNTLNGHDGNIDGRVNLRHKLSSTIYNATNVNFAINDVNNLPIDLLSLNAYCYNDQVNIVWETASELNNDYFTLEKSYDMNNWEIIDIVQGAGTSNQLNTYTSIDSKNDKLVYYKLTQTDFDGKYEIFSPISLDVCIDLISEYSVDAYPNPSVNNINIRINNYQYNNAILNIYNAVGQNIYNAEMNTANIAIDVSKWERGIYFTKVNIGEEVKMVKFILE